MCGVQIKRNTIQSRITIKRIYTCCRDMTFKNKALYYAAVSINDVVVCGKSF